MRDRREQAAAFMADSISLHAELSRSLSGRCPRSRLAGYHPQHRRPCLHLHLKLRPIPSRRHPNRAAAPVTPELEERVTWIRSLRRRSCLWYPYSLSLSPISVSLRFPQLIWFLT